MTHALQCPRCGRQVTVAEDTPDNRARCPHCERSFVIPGAPAGVAEEDDDWLSDELPEATASFRPPRPSRPQDDTLPGDSTLSGDSPGLGDSPGPKAGSVSGSDAASSKGSGKGDGGGANRGGTPRSVAGGHATGKLGGAAAGSRALPIGHETEYRVRCSVCGSVTYAKATQAGQTVKCHDCHTTIKIPPPPKKKVQPVFDAEEGESYRFEERPAAKRPDDPFRKSAEELLRQASESDEDEPEPDFDVPRIRDWAVSVFGILVQPAVMVHWIVLSLFGGGAAFVALSIGSPILTMGLFPTGVFFGAIVIACGFAILESVSNGEESVEEWPVMLDPTEWLGSLVVALSAVGLVGIPAWVLGQFVFGAGLAAVFVTMGAIYLLFPFVLLSMLDMQSIFTPFSAEVSRSVSRCHESWGWLYFSSGVLFGALFLIFVTATLFTPPVAALLCVIAGVGVTFLYFAMLGRLAYQIGQSLNAAPMENDIELIRQRKPYQQDELE